MRLGETCRGFLGKESCVPKASVAVFDYFITSNSPAGKCVLEVVRGLYPDHEITVFAAAFDDPTNGAARWIKIWAIRRPLIILYLTYTLCATGSYLWEVWCRRQKFDLRVCVDCNVPFGDVVYAHFCYKSYLFVLLRDKRLALSLWKLSRVTLAAAKTICESLLLRGKRAVIAPSVGLRDQLLRLYPSRRQPIFVIPNPIPYDVSATIGTPRDATRHALGFASDDRVIAFSALGNFEHKGLGLLIRAIGQVRSGHMRLLVIGGDNRNLAPYRRLAADLGCQAAITFLGFQKNVVPSLSAADACALPSRAEVFPMSLLEGAALGLPMIATKAFGVEEYLRHGQNGWLVERNVESIAGAITCFASLPTDELEAMKSAARLSVQQYSTPLFCEAWRRVLA